MQKSRLPKLVFVLLAVWAAFYFSSLYAQLPEVMASHFNARGVPNGWQTKSAFFSVLVGVSVLAAVIGFAIPRVISALPPEYVNLPNKGYWLAPEQRAETMDFLTGYFAWFGCTLFAVILISINFALQANLHPERRPDATPMFFVLASFLAFAIVGTIRMVKRFAPPPPDNSSLK
jgi:serine/threonine-protein kinase